MSSKTKKILAIVGGVVLAIAITFAVVSVFQGSKRNKAIEQQTAATEAQTAAIEQQAAEAEAARKADSIQDQRNADRKHKDDVRIAEAIEDNRPDPELCMTISWTATEQAWKSMPMSKEEVYALSRQSSYGDPVWLSGNVTEIFGSLVIRDLYSPCKTQTIIWYKYKANEDDDDAISATILLKGEFACNDLKDLPGGLNYQKKCCSRCILYGGKFYHTPESVGVIHDKCTSKKGCKDCVDAGDKQGDGAVPEKGTDSYAPKTRKSGRW